LVEGSVRRGKVGVAGGACHVVVRVHSLLAREGTMFLEKQGGDVSCCWRSSVGGGAGLLAGKPYGTGGCGREERHEFIVYYVWVVWGVVVSCQNAVRKKGAALPLKASSHQKSRGRGGRRLAFTSNNKCASQTSIQPPRPHVPRRYAGPCCVGSARTVPWLFSIIVDSPFSSSCLPSHPAHTTTEQLHTRLA